MKQIKLSHYVSNLGSYDVYLGNGTFYSFQSKRDAEAFLRATGKFLTQIFFESFKIYREVNRQYESIFLLLDGHVIKENKIIEELDSIRLYFNKLYIKPQCGVPPNHNYLAFINLHKSLNSSCRALELMHGIIASRSDTLLIYEFNSINQRICFLKKELDKYSISGSKKFEVPVHIPANRELETTYLRIA